MKLFTWLPGRQQDAAYYKWCFLYARIGRWGFDGYILKYPAKTLLHRHIDQIDGKMWRLNMTLSGNCMFTCDHTILRIFDWLILFRPDKYLHGLIVWTKTYKLSLGVAKFNRFRCQSHIEWNGRCSNQCDHCKEYYKPLTNGNQRNIIKR